MTIRLRQENQSTYMNNTVKCHYRFHIFVYRICSAKNLYPSPYLKSEARKIGLCKYSFTGFYSEI